MMFKSQPYMVIPWLGGVGSVVVDCELYLIAVAQLPGVFFKQDPKTCAKVFVVLVQEYNIEAVR